MKQEKSCSIIMKQGRTPQTLRLITLSRMVPYLHAKSLSDLNPKKWNILLGNIVEIHHREKREKKLTVEA